MHLRVLSRASALAVTQARLVARALVDRWPDVQVDLITRDSLGDRNAQVALAQATDKGLFTADLSDALVAGDADVVVHSWKDLPIEPRPDTIVAGTLERADVRDLLLVRAASIQAQPATLSVLTSSPRRAWQIQSSLGRLLPWPVSTVTPRDVRGNIPTRLDRLLAAEADGLVVAKAAIDRLLGPETPSSTREQIRRALAACRWMVLPVRDFPAAPAQGALALEVSRTRADVTAQVRAISHEPTLRACLAERRILQAHGGGCHEAIGATILVRDYGTVTSVRGRLPDGGVRESWTLDRTGPTPPKTSAVHAWPRPDEHPVVERRPVEQRGLSPFPGRGWWVSRAEALPHHVRPTPEVVLWTPGTRTWEKLANRGIWVHGCADGLGDAEDPQVDLLAGEAPQWNRLTHVGSGDPDSTATYEVHHRLPADLGTRSHFFWTSGSLFLAALAQHPAILTGWHASGPGRTSRVIRAALDDPDRASIWLDYHQWAQTVLS
jgi:hydroxymethylbilane synthase